MGDKRYGVRVIYNGSDKNYSPEFQTETKFRVNWQNTLSKAHGKASVTCLCKGNGNRNLAVKSLNNNFHLARFQKSGAEHALDCHYYSADYQSGASAYKKDVIEVTQDGGFKIKLGVGLQKGSKNDSESDGHQVRTHSGKRVSKPSIGLLGLLHFLWTQAQLNNWTPKMEGKRDLGLIHSKMLETAAKVHAGAIKLSDVLLVATPSWQKTKVASNDAKVAEAILEQHRLLVVAPLAAHTLERENCSKSKICIQDFHGIPNMMVDQAIWKNALSRFPRAVTAWRGGGKVIAIVQLDVPSAQDKAEVLNVSLMTVSEQWIPTDSKYEGMVEVKLRAEGRRFTKPLCHDADEDVVFPDFLLSDTDLLPLYPMEVYGMSTPEYLARKAIKKAHYGPGGCWSWDANLDQDGLNITAFPVRAQRFDPQI